MENNNSEDFVYFIESVEQALPELITGIKSYNFHQIGVHRNFFLKEFEILKMLSNYLPEKSPEKALCNKVINQWKSIDAELSKTPLNFPKVEKDILFLQTQLNKLISSSGGKKWKTA
ncbi:MAG: hypothetical protein HY860_01960 [Chlamydiales bacterium]|nr:hypothetical protein [Chlamydiales bacterium]